MYYGKDKMFGQKFEMTNNSFISISSDHILTINYNNLYEIDINSIKEIDIVDGYLTNKYLLVTTKDISLKIQLFLYNVEDICKIVNIVRSMINIPAIVIKNNKNSIFDKYHINFNRSKNSILRFTSVIILLLVLVFGGGIYRTYNQINGEVYYTDSSITKRMEDIFSSIFNKDIEVLIVDNPYGKDMPIIKIDYDYSSVEYEKIYIFIKKANQLETKYTAFIYEINNRYIRVAGDYLEVDNSYVWKKYPNN